MAASVIHDLGLDRDVPMAIGKQGKPHEMRPPQPQPALEVAAGMATAITLQGFDDGSGRSAAEDAALVVTAAPVTPALVNGAGH